MRLAVRDRLVPALVAAYAILLIVSNLDDRPRSVRELLLAPHVTAVAALLLWSVLHMVTRRADLRWMTAGLAVLTFFHAVGVFFYICLTPAGGAELGHLGNAMLMAALSVGIGLFAFGFSERRKSGDRSAAHADSAPPTPSPTD